MPTCDSHAPVASISLALLERYWRGHPPVHVLHYAARPRVEGITSVELHDCGRQEQSSWLATALSFLDSRAEELFLLLLDDYALCGPVAREQVVHAEQLMRANPQIGFFPLCWYPASRRDPVSAAAGVHRLNGTPILLQAALWRRDWFRHLARQMDRRTSAWGFESQATQLAKRSDRQVWAFAIEAVPGRGGGLIDGLEKSSWPVPYHNLMHRGQPDLRHEAFLHREGFAFPARGLGDTVARVAQFIGIGRIADVVEQTTGRGCGCKGRREKLNRVVPYTDWNRG